MTYYVNKFSYSTDYRSAFDKQELIVIEKVNDNTEIRNPKHLICGFGQNNQEGNLILSTRDFSEDKFEYDSEANVVYQGLEYEIKAVNLNNKKTVTILQLPAVKIISSLTFDWVTKNMFMIHKGKIKVFNIRHVPNKLVKLADLESYPTFFEPVIKVFPNNGY